MPSAMIPRTPEYFPKMKVRGAARKRKAPWQLLSGAARRAAESIEEFNKIMSEWSK